MDLQQKRMEHFRAGGYSVEYIATPVTEPRKLARTLSTASAASTAQVEEQKPTVDASSSVSDCSSEDGIVDLKEESVVGAACWTHFSTTTWGLVSPLSRTPHVGDVRPGSWGPM